MILEENDSLLASISSLEKQVVELRENVKKSPVNSIFAMAEVHLKRHFEDEMEQRVNKLKMILNLTDEQELAVRNYFAEKNARSIKMAELGMSGRLSPDELKEKMGPLYNQRKKEKTLMEEILSPEQLTAYENLKSKEKEESHQSSLQYELGELQDNIIMTEDQKDQIWDILANNDFELTKKERKSIHNS